MQIRRVVTGHKPDGKATVVIDLARAIFDEIVDCRLNGA
jgi:hypothetical protein